MIRVPKCLEDALKVDPEVMHGKICFSGTRVLLTIFLDNLQDGMGIDEFLINYPSVKKEQAHRVLEWENSVLREAAGMGGKALTALTFSGGTKL